MHVSWTLNGDISDLALELEEQSSCDSCRGVT